MEIVELYGLKIQVDRLLDAPAIQNGIDRGWYEGDEVAVARAVLEPQDRVLELGAGMGLVTSAIARIVGSEAILAYEPNPAIAARARANLELNGCDTVVRERLCLPESAKRTSAAFRLAEVFWASGLDRGGAAGEVIEVPVDPIETVIRDHRASVLVMDIEGGELDILHHADLSGLRALIFETHERLVGRRETNAAIRSACDRGFLIDFHVSRHGVVLLRREA